MGGNALAPQGAVRVEKAVYQKVMSTIDMLISGNGFTYQEIPSYRTKETFGDIDILVKTNVFNTKLKDLIIGTLESYYSRELPKVNNGKVLSIGIPLIGTDQDDKFLQVDFIFEDEKTYEFALRYYSWNDCGNLVGRIAHKMGLKFSHYGLIYTVLDGTNLIGEIEITLDFDKALEFLGFNSERWNQGFDTVEDIYEFIYTSAFFSGSIFALENRNHTARMRDRKRPTYMGFLKFIEGKESFYEFQEDKAVYLEAVFNNFPQIKFHHKEIVKNNEVVKKAKKLFNGDVVSKITELTGEKLGNYMKALRFVEPFNDYKFIAQMSSKDIKLEILKNYRNYKTFHKDAKK